MALLDWARNKKGTAFADPDEDQAPEKPKPLLKPRSLPPNIKTNIPGLEKQRKAIKDAENF